MAIVRIKDATVTRVNRNGYGVQVQEPEKQSNGRTFKGDRFTVWFKDAHGLAEGDRVSISGFLSAKVGEPWTDRNGEQRVSVDLSVNQPRIEQNDTPPSPAPTSDEQDDWSQPAFGNDSEVPF